MLQKMFRDKPMGVGRHVGTAAKLTAGQKTTKLGLGAGERGREFFVFVFPFLENVVTIWLDIKGGLSRQWQLLHAAFLAISGSLSLFLVWLKLSWFTKPTTS